MEFSWTEAQQQLHEKMMVLTQEKLNQIPCDQVYSEEFWSMCGSIGLLGLCVPKFYGGLGLDALSTAYSVEAFGYACENMGRVFATLAHLFACSMPMVDYGSEELKQRLLPPLCSGQLKGANAITETGAGSDVLALETEAFREDDFYVLSGKKSYVTNAPIADVFIVYASTNRRHGALGITAFAVERNSENLQVNPPFKKMGLDGASASSICLQECRVPASHRLGEEGQGGRIFQQSMQWERSCLFAAYIGMMDRQLEKTIAHALERRQFGRAIGKYQAVSHRIAEMKIRLESARLLLYRACWLLSQGKASLLEISMSKLAVSEAAIQSSLDAIRIHGGKGFMTEFGIEQGLRDAVPSAIFSGTSDMQLNIIAKELGL